MDPRVYYLSAWEFLIYWYVKPLQPPSEKYLFTRWRTPEAIAEDLGKLHELPPTDVFIPGLHYEVNDEWCETQADLCVYPDTVQTGQ
jgi:hypothetical protein